MHKKAFAALATGLLVLIVMVASPTEAATYTISVQTDASSYSGAQTMKVSGAISPAPGPGTAVLLQVLNPSGKLAAVGQASVNGSTGSYKQSFVLGGSSNWVAGTYTVNATWGNSATGPSIFKTTTFAYTPAVTTTTGTTTTTSTSSSSTTTTTTSSAATTSVQTSTTTSSSTTTTQVTSTPPSTSSTTTTQTTTSSSTQGGGGGIPEFPYQTLAVTLFTLLVVASYLLARRNATVGGIVRRP